MQSLMHSHSIRWAILSAFCVSGAMMVVLALAFGPALAQDISGALYSAKINIINNGIDRENYAAAADISGAALIDGNFMAPDALNSVVLKGTQRIPAMPPSNRILVEGLVVDDGGVFTEFTTEAQSAALNDVPLLPTNPTTGDAVYFGFDNPARILTLEIGIPSGHDLDLTWQYNTAGGYVDLNNVDDRTNAFTRQGRRAVSWDMPTETIPWIEDTVTGSAIMAYWVRAVVGDVRSTGAQPLADRAFYENGQWWVWDDALSAQNQEQYTLFLGGPDIVSSHSVFVGDAGITTPDAAILELGDIYGLIIDARLSFEAPGSSVCIACKGNDFRLYVSDTDAVTLDATGSGGVSLTVSGIILPAIGAQTIIVGSDGTDLTLSVQGFGTASGAAQDIPDNSDDWEWGTNGAVVYFDSIVKQPSDPTDTLFIQDQGEWNTGTFDDTQSDTGDPITHYRRVSNASNQEDGFQTEETSSVNTSSTFVQLGTFAGPSTANAWFTFRDVVIDPGTTLASAVVQFTPSVTNAGTDTEVLIQAVDSCDATPPTSSAEFDALPLTTASVSWSLPGFVLNTALDSANFASVINELVTDCGGLSGDIVLVLSNVGSTVENKRVHAAQVGVRDVRYATLKLSSIDFANNDFIQLGANAAPPAGWAATGSCNRSSSLNTAFIGRRSLRVSSAVGAAQQCDTFSPVFAAAPGQQWSSSVRVARIGSSTTSVTARMIFRWLDADTQLISSVTDSLFFAAFDGGESMRLMEHDGLTAPAGTAFAQVLLRLDCTGDCTLESKILYWDAATLCQNCAVPVSFGSFQNLLAATGDFGDLTDQGNWISPVLNLTGTNAQSSSVSWVSLVPEDTTLLAETSIDNQLSWQEVTNGGAIPGLGTGDVSGTDVNLRFTMTATGADVGVLTPYVSDASILVENLGDADLRYELNTVPGVTIADRSGNGNTGTLSYPVPLANIIVSLGALTPLQRVPSLDESLPVPGVAGAASGSAVDDRMFDTSGLGLNLPFGGVLNDAAGQGQIPVQLLWAILVGLVTLLIGAAAFTISSLAAIVIMATGLGLAALIGVGMPAWTVFIMLPVDMAVLMLWRRVLAA